ncbi:MAG: ABC transporter ATP-binding protein [Patescibacteria group bacterium]
MNPKNNYKLNRGEKAEETSLPATLKKMWALIESEKRRVLLAFVAILTNSGLLLTGPYLVGYAITHYIIRPDYHMVLVFSGILLGVYSLAFVAQYLQVKTMGTVGQNVLWKLRNDVFQKLQSLPLAFFNQNKTGDLISRINNDTDKLNQFFSQALMQFVGTIFMVTGAGIFLLVINFRLAVAVLLPAVLLLLFTRISSGWIKSQNLKNLQSTGGMSSEIQESLANFKVIIAFNRRDYFRQKFSEANEKNYRSAIASGIANGILSPIFDFASNVAQLIFLGYGIYLISTGALAIGFFVSFLTYINRFYDPLRQLANLWATFQAALAGWDRIGEILRLESDLAILPPGAEKQKDAPLLEFKDVSFGYPDGNLIINNISFALEAGKTYALVGPTGGGKTTTASLMARLYDPTEGTIFLEGRDIRGYEPTERTKKIGFILQEPFLFNGTVRENILYGNEEYANLDSKALEEMFAKADLGKLLSRFTKGLDTEVKSSGDATSLGQRQLIAFMRALIRRPDLLILDEATANIDTVTEALLQEIINKLPKETTKVIIAHRLNTIENADHIFFVNGGTITPAGSFEHAIEMLLHGKRKS